MNSTFKMQPGQVAYRSRIILLVTFLTLSLALTAFAAKPAHAATATLTVVNPQIALGDGLIISGTGFASGEKIALWVTTPDGRALDGAYLNASADGTFSNFTNPDYTFQGSPGMWHATVQGLTSGATASENFEVMAPTLQATGIFIGPLVVVVFSGQGWLKGDRVQVWITNPATGTVYSDQTTYAWATTGGDIPASPGLIVVFEGKPGTYAITVAGTTNVIESTTFTAS
jgi:hypothetical protein